MTKNIYLTILTLITCLCIVIGCWRYIFSADKNNDSITDTQSVDAFHTLMADTNVMDVIVTTGDTYSVSYTCKSNLTPEIIQKNDKLTLTGSLADFQAVITARLRLLSLLAKYWIYLR